MFGKFYLSNPAINLYILHEIVSMKKRTDLTFSATSDLMIISTTIVKGGRMAV